MSRPHGEHGVGADISRDMPVEIAQGIASGDLHPETRLPIEDQWPEFKPIPRIQKIVLGESSKVNEGTGPMDAFISRKLFQIQIGSNRV